MSQTKPAKRSSTYSVVCLAFETKPTTSRDAAERQLAEVDRLGACMYPHEIRESVRDA